MGFSNTYLKVESVTPEQAKEFLAVKYAHQRRARPHWVKHLAREMAEGRFMPSAEIHVMYVNGEPALINGQHTCMAIVEYGKPVRVTVRKTSTSEMGQIAMYYAFGHDNGVKRTFKDGLGAYNISEEIGLGSHYVELVSTALRHIRANFREDGRGRAGVSPMPLTEMVELLPAWSEYGKMFWDNTPAPAGELTRVKRSVGKRGALSVLLVTYRYQVSKAREFWSGIVSPGLTDNDPRWYARRVIEDAARAPGRAYTMSPAMLSRLLAKCWNNYTNGLTMGQSPRRSDIDENAKIVILGTPFNGKQPNPPWLPG